MNKEKYKVVIDFIETPRTGARWKWKACISDSDGVEWAVAESVVWYATKEFALEAGRLIMSSLEVE